MKILYFFLILVFTTACLITPKVYGDGLAFETLPPSLIGNKNVTMSIGSTPFLVDNNNTGTQINLVLMDATNKQPIPDATIAISAFKGTEPLLGHIFKSDAGTFLLNFYPEESGKISVEEEGGMLSSFLGQSSGKYDIKGPIFNSGGLYQFKIDVITMGSYNNKIEKSFNAAISIPEYDNFTIHDPKYGKQQIQIIAYYDRLHNISYDQGKKFLNFTMPFNWSEQNIDKLTVVHQEIKIPRSFGDFVVAKYDTYVNNIKIPDKSISIDDYSLDADRIVHLILYRHNVLTLLSEQKNPGQEMSFAIRPSNTHNFPIVQLTRNAQYNVALSWNPPNILAGSTTRFNFKISDPNTKNTTTDSITYDMSVLEGKNGAIYHQIGKTTGSNAGDNVDVTFPYNYTGLTTIAFENINGNSFADTEFTAAVSNKSIVPEFPSGTVIILVTLFGLSVFLTRTRLSRI